MAFWNCGRGSSANCNCVGGASELTMATRSSYKTKSVKEKVSLKKFVQDCGLEFKKGCGYYQLTKPEVIQDYKKVVARRKTDGSFVTGDVIKEILGIKTTSKKYSVKLSDLPDFDIFVQSTSVNRVLLPGTEFLYEDGDKPVEEVCVMLCHQGGGAWWD